MSKKIVIVPLLFFSLCLSFIQVGAQEQKEKKGLMEKIVIKGHPLSADGLAQPSDIVFEEELSRRLTDTIGSTLSFKPSLHSTFFGPSVGRPVIRGFDGVRVRVMEDRIDTLDISTGSVDHVVALSVLSANEIEILKGASTLIYGSGAIGGAVNVRTGRVPTQVPDKDVSGKLYLKAADNGNAKQGALSLDGGRDFFAWHFDGFYRDSDDIEIPGFATSAQQLAIQKEEEHEDEHEEELVRGILPFSAYESYGGSIGFSLVGKNDSFIGVSLSQLSKEYGLPGFSHSHDHDEHGEEHDEHDHDEHHEEEDLDEEEFIGRPHIDLEQMRIDLKMALMEPFSGWEELKLDWSMNIYEHSEIEESGVVGTKFENDAWEGRLEAAHVPVAQWSGVVGIQTNYRDYVASGEEALTPPVVSTSYGLFWIGQRNLNKLQLETGVRLEYVNHDPSGNPSIESKNFTTGSASFGAVLPFRRGWQLSGLVDWASRAPVSEELFSNGPHFAAQSFDIGDPTLDNEVALNFSSTLSYKRDGLETAVTAYLTEFTNFIYPTVTGEEEDDLPIYQFRESEATFVGFDVNLSFPVYSWSGGQRLALKTFFDYVSARVDVPGNRNVPRVPPQRASLGLEFKASSFIATVDYLYVFEQEDTTDYELPTDAYEDIQAYLGWTLPISGMQANLFLLGRNLTNSEQRYHTSIIKDLAPGRGRSLEGGIHMTF